MATLDETPSGKLAARLQQTISQADTAGVGGRILSVVDELKPTASTFAEGMLKYRQHAIAVDRAHMRYAHSMMRVMLDSLLATEQGKAARIQFWTSVLLAIVAILVTVAVALPELRGYLKAVPPSSSPMPAPKKA